MKKLNLADDSGKMGASSSSNGRQKRLLIILLVVLLIAAAVIAAQQFLFKEKKPVFAPMRPRAAAIPPSPPAPPPPSVNPSEPIPPSPATPPVSVPSMAAPSPKAEEIKKPKPSKSQLKVSALDRKTLPARGYTLQVLACAEEKNALENLQKLKTEGFSPTIVKAKATLTKHSVYLGDFSGPEEAASFGTRLKEDEISAILYMTGGGRYSFLISSYFSLNEAIDASHDLEKKGYPARIRGTTAQTSVYQVRIGHFANRGQAAAPIQRLQDLGYSPVVVRE